MYVAVSEDGAALLADEAAAVSWVHDAFAHLKVIGATEAAKPLLEAAGVEPDGGVILGGKASDYLKVAAQGRIFDREPTVRTIY